MSLKEKYLKNRECVHQSFSRDEIYELYINKGFMFPNKRADDLFVRSNQDGDNIISCDEFVEIYMLEVTGRMERRQKIA